MAFSRIKSESLSEKTKKEIRKYIESLDLEKTTKLPREEILAKKLGVSRITVRRALNELSKEGTIFRLHGKGTFINTEALKINVNLNPSKEYEQMIKSSGYKASVEILNVSKVKNDKKLAEILSIPQHEEILVVEKLFYADKNPCIYCIDRVPIHLLGGDMEKDKFYKSTYQLIKDHSDNVVVWDKIELSTVTFDDENLSKYKDIFNCKSLLSISGINYNKDNQVVLYASEYIDTNYIKFNLIRQRNINYRD